MKHRKLETKNATFKDILEIPILESKAPKNFCYWAYCFLITVIFFAFALNKNYSFNFIVQELAIVVLPMLIFSWGLYIFKTVYYRKKGNAILLKNGILKAENMKGIKKYNIINIFLTLMTSSRLFIQLTTLVIIAGCIQK